ncbi:DUF4905 domain-containing protein [Parapedobacter sp. GCM10030251]|uniref:DUF4905 domain-containing protein n=1 Tax=Parapedobacter sp. GCM10030251 TaxID=3273419 RepID=UPI00360722EB
MDKYTLKTAFRKSFLGTVWRIEADTTRGILAIETRNPDTGVPAFSAIDYHTGMSFVDEKPYGDRNWSLAGIVNDKLIVRAWGQNSPEGAGIACIDAPTGQVIWEQFNYMLVALANQQLVVRHRNFASGYEQYLNPVDGSLTKKNDIPNKPASPEIVLPQRYGGDIPSFLEGYAITGDLVCCPIEDRMFWAFHEALDDGYHIRLVASCGAKMLTDEIIVSDLPKMAPELFFMIGNQLFFIGDNKQEIVAYLV